MNAASLLKANQEPDDRWTSGDGPGSAARLDAQREVLRGAYRLTEASMRYIVRRIIPSSAARLGCVLGWLVAFFPAICMAILVGEALRRINQIFEQITPVVITVLGQQVARIDFLEILRLSAISQTTARLVENYLATFLALVVVLALAGGFILLIAGLLFTLGYNWLARGGWGLVIELIEEEERPV